VAAGPCRGPKHAEGQRICNVAERPRTAEELARNALAESPEREKRPETTRSATFTLVELQADEDEGRVLVLTFGSPEDPGAEHFVDFCGGTVEGVARY